MIPSQIHLNSPLWKFISARAIDLRYDADKEAPPFFIGADYWLLASCLQKAIRRGDCPSARRAAHQLYETDQQRLWRRLIVIALEDIGIGDVEAAVQIIALATKPRWREEFGGDRAVLDRVVMDGCCAVKDRSGDHIASLLSVANPQRFLTIPANAPRSELLVAVASQKLPSMTRLDAAVRAAELISTPSRPPQARLAGLDALFGTYREIGCPILLIEACKTYLGWSRDILPLVLPLVWVIWRESGYETQGISHAPVTEYFEGGLPAYAFDPLHTRPGKQAVVDWLGQHASVPWKPSQIAAGLWNHEAAACDRTLAWEEGARLRQMAYRVDLLKVGVRPEDCDALMAWVSREHRGVVAAREIIWKTLNHPSERSAEGLERANPHLPVSGE